MFASLRSLLALRLCRVALLLSVCATANAGGPRWVTGPPFFSTSGNPVVWYTTHPLYYTDPGDLSASVPHAAADALVARAAAVWNVPTSSLVLAQGGLLDEHVTGASLAVGGTLPTLPADARSTNYQAKQIAVIYDTDGSAIDALLGAGGSDPTGCLQTGVVESVDSFGAAGTIQHAVLLLNGRCTGAEPEKQLQLQYQLVRAFGRVLGLGWSQTNDNVFTNAPVPTYTQALYWPIMHPIDINCGLYTYQCLPQPFTLRADDLSGLASLYLIGQGQSASQPGKQDTLANGSTIDGRILFPNGQGMEGVNVTVRRRPYFSPTIEDWQVTSSVSGYTFRRQTVTPFTTQDGSASTDVAAALASIGTYDLWREGYWRMERVPLPEADPWQSMVITTEAVNPLYTGSYALTSMAPSGITTAPSGSRMQLESDIESRYYNWDRFEMTARDAVSDCHAGNDGAESAPAAMGASGWWNGVLCGYGHAAWTSLTIKAHRSMTVEVTAFDETGAASQVKAMPMVGIWRAGDAVGVAPTVAATPTAFNSFVVGMSPLTVQGAATTSLRLAIADTRGAGRPDFNYQARVLYADAVQPANLGTNGGTIVISGTGFRAGNVVTVNGVAAQVTSVTATTITAVAPSLRALGSSKALLATIAVRDSTTSGATVMTAALGYGSPQQRLQLVSAPSGSVPQDSVAATSFSVRVLASDGVTPVANEPVTFSSTTASATFGVCGATLCTITSNSQGIATTSVTPTATGTINLQASTSVLSVAASFTAVVQHDVLTLMTSPSTIETVGLRTAQAFAVRVTAADGVTPRANQTIILTAINGAARLEACGAAVCSLTTDAAGVAASVITPLVSGTISLSAAGTAGSVTTNFRAAASSLSLVSAPSGLATVGAATATPFVVRVLRGDGVSPLVGEAVVLMALGSTVRFTACGGSTCTILTDAQGMAASGVIVQTAGPLTVSAVATSGSVSASFTAGAQMLQPVSVPSGAATVGVAATTPFTVRLLSADGVHPAAGEPVRFQTTSGSAILSSCGAGDCLLTTDASGLASVLITPTAAGLVTVGATSPAGSVTASLTASALPALIQVVQAPAASVFVGDVLPAGVTVRLLSDGGTPVANGTVQFTVTAGAAMLGSCGASACTGKSDANGLVTLSLQPAAAGTLTVSATAAGSSGIIAQNITIAVAARQRSLVVTRPVLYVAEGVPFRWTPAVALSDNSAPTDGVVVLWNSGSGLSFMQASSSVSGGVAATVAQVSGLGAGMATQGSVCAWGGVCGSVQALGVSAAEWKVEVVSGAGQNVDASEALQPVTVRVTDAAGHPVAGARISVYQTVTAAQQPCPDHGRCPAPASLQSDATAAVTDVDGLSTVTPLSSTSISVVTQITIAAGTQGSATVALLKHL